MTTPIAFRFRRATCLVAFGMAFLGALRAADQPPASTPAPAEDTSSATSAVPPAVENSVVQIFSIVRPPSLLQPWTKGAPQQISGSGVVIEGKRILTNAHVVRFASQIQVQASHSADKISAKVEFIATGIDLAVLSLDDPSFFDSHPPLPRAANIPNVKDAVLTYGFPTGGNNLSITKGIVSRIEFVPYNEDVGGLRIQTDAAINPGNSGGPVVVNNEMIGLAFSRATGNTQNIGYIIPCEEIELFLKDIASGHYTGKPAMFDSMQRMENSALRPFLKVDSSVHGIIVDEPFDDDPAYPLKKWDIITKIGESPVDDQGMVSIGNDLRVQYRYLVQKLAKDGKLPLTIVRNGKEMNIQLPVAFHRPMLIPFIGDNYPSYYVFGPMVFTKATQEFIPIAGGSSNTTSMLTFQTELSVMESPLVTRRSDKPAFPGEELVVVASPFFPHKIDQGYSSNPRSLVVKSVNDIPIKNLVHLVQVLNSSKDEFLKFEFAGHEMGSFIFPRQAMKDSTEEILTDNDIRSQGSPDVLPKADAAAK